MSVDSTQEGWGVIRPGDRRAHYYRGEAGPRALLESVCGRVGFYRPPEPLGPDNAPSRDDCAACRKVLTREAKR